MNNRFPFLGGLFGHKPISEHCEPARVYIDLQNKVFATRPATIGFAKHDNESEVWGVVMETGYDEGVSTLVTLGDGTVSLYYSGGGGLIGLGAHDGPRKASQALLASAPQFLQHCRATTQYPLPKRGCTRFYLMTHGGTLTDEAKEEDLGRGRHTLSPLFHKAHALIIEALAVNQKGPAE